MYKIKGPLHTALITDAMRAAGMPEGESILGGLKNGTPVIVEDGVAKLTDRSSFAGSVATADRLVRTMIGMGGVSLLDTIQMITETPARIMGIQDRIGSLQEGKDADILIFPSLESCNPFYKGLMLFANGKIAGLIRGTEKPVVLMSRSETEKSKYYCIALSCLMI